MQDIKWYKPNACQSPNHTSTEKSKNNKECIVACQCNISLHTFPGLLRNRPERAILYAQASAGWSYLFIIILDKHKTSSIIIIVCVCTHTIGSCLLACVRAPSRV